MATIAMVTIKVEKHFFFSIVMKLHRNDPAMMCRCANSVYVFINVEHIIPFYYDGKVFINVEHIIPFYYDCKVFINVEHIIPFYYDCKVFINE
jgi:hypothetical protein